MLSMCSELTPGAPIPDSRIAQFMQPWSEQIFSFMGLDGGGVGVK